MFKGLYTKEQLTNLPRTKHTLEISVLHRRTGSDVTVWSTASTFQQSDFKIWSRGYTPVQEEISQWDRAHPLLDDVLKVWSGGYFDHRKWHHIVISRDPLHTGSDITICYSGSAGYKKMRSQLTLVDSNFMESFFSALNWIQKTHPADSRKTGSDMD